jgi:hypothetical protein
MHQPGSIPQMWSEDGPPAPIAVLGPPAVAVVSGLILYFLPNEVLTFLTVWVVASLPIGVLIGHCALSEEE